MSRFLIAALVVAGFAAAPVQAQVVPLAQLSLAPRIGFESLGPPVVVVDAAPRLLGFGALPFATARLDLHARSIAAGAGLQLEQEVVDWFFVREAISGGPVVVAVDGVAVGLRSELVVQAAFFAGDVVLATGPRLGGSVVVDQAADAHVFAGWSAAVLWPVADGISITVDGSAGTDIGGYGDGAVAGSLFAGVRFEADVPK